MKYKINDKVKVITQEESSDKPYIGKTYKVEKAFSCGVGKRGYYLKGISSLSVLRDRLHFHEAQLEPYLEATPPEPTHPNKCNFMGCQVCYPIREEPKKDDSDYQFYPLDSYSSFPVAPSDGRIFHYVKAGAMIFGNERYLARWGDTSNEKSEEESEVNNKTMALIIGEKYVPSKGASCGNFYSNAVGAVYVVITNTDGFCGYDIYDKDDNKLTNCVGCFNEINLEPYSPTGHKKGLMKTLSIMAAKLVDSDVKAFVEAGILDSELTITEVGRDFVLTQVLNDNKTKYATEARKTIAEEKKTKEGK